MKPKLATVPILGLLIMSQFMLFSLFATMPAYAQDSGGGGGDSSETDRGQTDCDAKPELTSPLSWIACPLIDMGVAMTDQVFEKFIKPMLATVPVSTDTNHGSYLAWQQFRIIANILLVGTLLMVVFSQAKGGGQ